MLSIFPDSIAKKMTEEIIRDLEEEFANFGDKELELPFLLSGKRDAQFHRSLMDRCENVRYVFVHAVLCLCLCLHAFVCVSRSTQYSSKLCTPYMYMYT